MKIETLRKAGFTLLEIMIVLVIIGLLAGIAISNSLHARSLAQMNTCINNLRLINSAKQEWAMEKGKTQNDTPADTDIQPYLGRGANGSLARVVCPLNLNGGFDGSYTIGNMSTPPQCLIQPNGDANGDYKHVLSN